MSTQTEDDFAQRLRVQAARVAPYYRTVLLVGGAGCGKRRFAEQLHRLSPVAAGEFVVCGGGDLSDAAMDRARCGTLYVEGLAGLGEAGQVQLVRQIGVLDRAMRAREAGTRLVCSSVSELRGMVAAGRMRQDLYARVGVLEIRVGLGRPAVPAGEVRLDAVMRRHVADVLERCEGNKLRASEMLGISRSTLYRMLEPVAG